MKHQIPTGAGYSFEIDFPWNIHVFEVGLNFNCPVQTNKMVLLVSAKGGDGENIESSSKDLSYSRALDQWFFYAPAIDRAQFKNVGSFTFGKGIRKLTITPITWTECQMVSRDILSNLFVKYRSDSLVDHSISVVRGDFD